MHTTRRTTRFHLATISLSRLFVFSGLGTFRSAADAIAEYGSKPRNRTPGDIVIAEHDTEIGITRTYYSIQDGRPLDTTGVESLLA